MKIVNLCIMFSIGWLGCWFFELVVLFQLVVFLVSLLFRVDWLGWLGLKFLFENFQFLRHVFSWLVGLVGLLVFSVGRFLQLVVF